ncbi:MAG: hypothetical protein EBQ95_03335 [Gammaproteobacteria bacterium]|nr:hypothetical protein [Gammaproteobacteria bacterium]
MTKIFVLIFSLLSFSGFACHQSLLNAIDNETNTQSIKFQQVDYNYSCLKKVQKNFMEKKAELLTCLKIINRQKINVSETIKKHQQLNIPFTKQEQDTYQIIEHDIQKKIKFIDVLIAKIDNFLIIIDKKMQDAQFYNDTRIQRKNIYELLRSNDYTLPQIIPLKIVFYFLNEVKDKHLALFFIYMTFLLSLGVLARKYLNIQFLKEKNTSKRVFYKHVRLIFPIFIITFGTYILIYINTKDWLVSPSGLIFTKALFIMLLFQMMLYHLVYFFEPNRSLEFIDKTSNALKKVIFIFYIIGFVQFIYLEMFISNTLIQMIYLAFLVIFYPASIFFLLRFIWILTDKKYSNKKAIFLKFVRYSISLFVVIFYVVKLGLLIQGKVLNFTASQFFLTLLIIIYYTKWLGFQQEYFDNKTKFELLETIRKTIAFKILVWIINIALLYKLFIYILIILTIPEYYIYNIQDSLSRPIHVSMISFSIFNLIWSILLFFTILVIGKITSDKICNRNEFSQDNDKKHTIKLIINFICYVLATLVSLMILGLSMTHISLIIGGLGFSIGLGLQSIIKEIVYGLFIVVKKSVRVGDFVVIKEVHTYNIYTTGEIIKISMLQTQILDENLMIIAIPNSYVLENALINYSASEFMNKCYINCVLDNEESLASIYEQISLILKNEPRIVQKEPYQPLIKTFSTNNQDNTNSVMLNINFFVCNLSQKLMVVNHIKNKIVNQLKLEIKKT